MRLVSLTFRNVKSKHIVLHSRSLLAPRPCQPYRWDSQPSVAKHGGHARPYFSASYPGKPRNVIKFIPCGIPNSPTTWKTLAPRLKTGFPLVQDERLFGKWKALLTNSFRLAIESDFDRRGPAKKWPRQLLVDKQQNRGDLALWSCLLDFQKRMNGDTGVRNVWRSLWGRRSIHDVWSPLALGFWQTILEAALRSGDDKFLSDIWIYSEWMYDLHRVKWPRLYLTIMSHFLRTHQHQQALQWQLRLTPNFYPGADEFADMIKEFAADHELYRTPTLQSLYITNPSRRLYDIIVPYLYGLGASQLAMKWRHLCSRHDDLPQAAVPVRPFLRFLRGYFPHITLRQEESSALDDLNYESKPSEDKIQISREFMNRVHGGTFGISAKSYNDQLGAKWLASSWISLNLAIRGIAALGIDQIGPLSLQSIALREGTSKGVLARIDQLKEFGISVVESNYLKLVLYLARIGDDELLLDLLHSDLHPDVFDDLDLQSQLVISTAESEDWRTHRLMLTTQLIVMKKSAREAANALARAYILRQDQYGLSNLLDDMKPMEIAIDSEQTNLIFNSLMTGAKSTFLSPESLFFYLPICRKLASMEVPVPVDCWRKLLFCLARQTRLEELEKLCIELVNLYTSSESSRPGFVPVHPEDIPEPMKTPLSGVENLLGLYIPMDLPSQTPLHPLRRIFDNKLLSTILRYSFYSASGRRFVEPADLWMQQPKSRKFDGRRAVKLLRILHDKGMFLHSKRLATWVMVRLITFYGPGSPTKRPLQIARARNTLPLKTMKTLLDEAWGEEFLPPLEALQAAIRVRGQKVMLNNMKYLRARRKMAAQLHVVL